MQRQDNLHSRLSSIRLTWRQGGVKSPHPDKQPWRNPLARFPPVSTRRVEQVAVYESPAESSKKKWLKEEDDMKSLGENSFSSSFELPDLLGGQNSRSSLDTYTDSRSSPFKYKSPSLIRRIRHELTSPENLEAIASSFTARKLELVDIENQYQEIKRRIQKTLKSSSTVNKDHFDQETLNFLKMTLNQLIQQRALKQDNLASELTVLRETIKAHQMTDDCESQLRDVWNMSDESLIEEFQDSPLRDVVKPPAIIKTLQREIKRLCDVAEVPLIKKSPNQSIHRRQVETVETSRKKSEEPLLFRNTSGSDPAASPRRWLFKKYSTSPYVVIPPNTLVVRTGNRLELSLLSDFCYGLSSQNSIQSLDISNNWITSEGTRRYFAQAIKTCTFLQTLILAKNDIRYSGMIALSQSLKELTGLTHLSLADNQIGDAGVEVLALSTPALSMLKYLDLSLNKISSNGLVPLGQGLKEITSLQGLELSGNIRQYSYQSSDGPDFLKKLQWIVSDVGALPSLTYLGIASNSFLLGGSRALVNILTERRSTLVELDIGGRCGAYNRIGSEGIKALMAGFFWTPLTTLDLSNNDLGSDGIKSFATAFSIHTTLLSLNLKGNHMGFHGMRSLVGMLVKHSRLTRLDVSDNNLGSRSIYAFSEAIGALELVSQLSISSNPVLETHLDISQIEYEGLQRFVEVLKTSSYRTHLISLDVQKIDLDKRGRQMITSVVITNTCLRILNGINLEKKNVNILPQNMENYEALFAAQIISKLDLKKVEDSPCTSIDLSGCGLNEFPSVLFRLKNLREIQLGENNFRKVPTKGLLEKTKEGKYLWIRPNLAKLNLKGCHNLIHPPKYLADDNTKDVIEYLKQCKVKNDRFRLSLILIGENDDAKDLLISKLKNHSSVCEYGTNGQVVAKAPQEETAYPREVQWTPEFSNMYKFSLMKLSGAARFATCRQFMLVQDAVYCYVLSCSGSLETKVSMWSNLDSLAESMTQCVILFALVVESEDDEEEVLRRYEIVKSYVSAWRMRKESFKLLEAEVVYLSSMSSHWDEFCNKIQDAVKALLEEVIEWNHPLFEKIEHRLCKLAQERRVHLPWKDYISVCREEMDNHAFLQGQMNLNIINDFLHSRGIIRWIGTAGISQKPVLDTVIINPFEMNVILSKLPSDASSWKDWQVMAWIKDDNPELGRNDSFQRSSRALLFSFVNHFADKDEDSEFGRTGTSPTFRSILNRSCSPLESPIGRGRSRISSILSRLSSLSSEGGAASRDSDESPQHQVQALNAQEVVTSMEKQGVLKLSSSIDFEDTEDLQEPKDTQSTS
uniref:Uncharacterized protein n=1 Tax=Guillardia theta TaxID=55529 RepID=A0A6U6B202_GUITH|mmetsp:Transcript_35328/g.110414  ORF Transcript_35328/g.110414 Transcript_35328/m.110414 type:complete len:1311 (+) Transcript_35328:204-4136(+)